MNYRGHDQQQDDLRRQQLEYRLMLEFHMMREFSLTGVFVFPELSNLLIWHGVIFVRELEYKGGVFKFRVRIPEEYPNQPPVVEFKCEMYHPLIHPTTQILELLPQALNWQPKQDCLFKVFAYLKRAFYSRDLWTEENVPNPLVSISYREGQSSFMEGVQHCIALNETHLHDTDENSSIRFPAFTAEHQQLLEALNPKDKQPREADQFDTFIRWFRKRYSRQT